VKASVDRALSVKRVFYAGDEGGIVCAVTPSRAAKQVFTVSLTHVRIAPHHPLLPAVLVYQREREKASCGHGGVGDHAPTIPPTHYFERLKSEPESRV